MTKTDIVFWGLMLGFSAALLDYIFIREDSINVDCLDY